MSDSLKHQLELTVDLDSTELGDDPILYCLHGSTPDHTGDAGVLVPDGLGSWRALIVRGGHFVVMTHARFEEANSGRP